MEIFHGGTALGGFANNSVKSIQTRSGHRIVFTEDESIIITDKSGNEIHLDTTGSNINITAGNDITEIATGNRMEMSNNRTEMTDETVLRNSKNSETFAGEININTTKENMTMQSAKTIEWNSGEKSNLF